MWSYRMPVLLLKTVSGNVGLHVANGKEGVVENQGRENPCHMMTDIWAEVCSVVYVEKQTDIQ